VNELKNSPHFNWNAKDVNPGDYSRIQFEEWLNRLLGYFAVELAILHSTSSLLSSVEVNAVWEQTLIQIVISLKELLFESESYYSGKGAINLAEASKDSSSSSSSSGYTKYSPSTTSAITYSLFCLKVKQAVAKFCLTVQQKLGFDVIPLIDILEQHKDKFATSLSYEVQQRIQRCFKTEPYTSMYIENTQQHASIVNLSLLTPVPGSNTGSNMISEETYNNDRTIACSKTVPEITEVIGYHYLGSLFEFSEYLGSMEDNIRKDLVAMLSFVNEWLDKCLSTISYQNLPQYTIICINAEFMGRACRFLEREYYSKGNINIPESVSVSGELSFLKISYSLFQQTRARAEDMVMKAILQKLDITLSAMGTVNWNWSESASTGASSSGNASSSQQLGSSASSPSAQSSSNNGNTVHEFVTSIISYLDSCFNIMRFLAKEKREFFLFQLMQTIVSRFTHNITHVSGSMLDFTDINMTGIKAMRKDLDALEGFANKIAFQKAKFVFQDLNQVLDFILKQDMSMYKGELFQKLFTAFDSTSTELTNRLEQQTQTTELSKLLLQILQKLKMTSSLAKQKEETALRNQLNRAGAQFLNAMVAVGAWDVIDDDHSHATVVPAARPPVVKQPTPVQPKPPSAPATSTTKPTPAPQQPPAAQQKKKKFFGLF